MGSGIILTRATKTIENNSKFTNRPYLVFHSRTLDKMDLKLLNHFSPNESSLNTSFRAVKRAFSKQIDNKHHQFMN